MRAPWLVVLSLCSFLSAAAVLLTSGWTAPVLVAIDEWIRPEAELLDRIACAAQFVWLVTLALSAIGIACAAGAAIVGFAEVKLGIRD
jgi:hypothetical protein